MTLLFKDVSNQNKNDILNFYTLSTQILINKILYISGSKLKNRINKSVFTTNTLLILRQNRRDGTPIRLFYVKNTNLEDSTISNRLEIEFIHNNH